MTTPLPHRFSEKSFRRYEPIIATVVSEFPNVTLVRPSDLELSAETVAAEQLTEKEL